MDIKNINIGECIQTRVKEAEIPIERICNFLKVDQKAVLEMYTKDSLDTEILLRWSKLLEYDFFRLYSQHLILYAPPAPNTRKEKPSSLPQFRKNLYTQEIIQFVLELIETEKKTKLQIIQQYKIPKTTLYKWIDKYKKKPTEDETQSKKHK